MKPLNDKQKQLLFDYCIGLTSEEETRRAEQLIGSSKQAAEICSQLKAVFSPLDSLQIQACPDELAERTILRLENQPDLGRVGLQKLLTAEQDQNIYYHPSRLWKNIGQIAAVAAVIVFITGVLIAPLKRARQNYWQQRCRMQLSNVFSGLNNYLSDYDGKLPAVATASGQPWWKVGDQGKENCSNTRHIWLLVKGGYVSPNDFVCPGKSQGRPMQFEDSQLSRYNDFPARRYVTYSFRIIGDKSDKDYMPGQTVLIADLNPLFEKLPKDYSKPLKVKLNRILSTTNSKNHNRRGQNILFSDGRADFIKKRNVGILQDDIFTVHDTDIYHGVELPGSQNDVFLAP